jgi:hypothetical protein
MELYAGAQDLAYLGGIMQSKVSSRQQPNMHHFDLKF